MSDCATSAGTGEAGGAAGGAGGPVPVVSEQELQLDLRAELE